MGDKEEVNASKKRKKTTDDEVLREKLNEALKRNDDLVGSLSKLKDESEYKINYLIKENNDLQVKLENLIKLYNEKVKTVQCLESSEDEMEAESEAEIQDGNEEGVVAADKSAKQNVAKDKISTGAKPKERKGAAKKISEKKKEVKIESKSVPVLTTYGINVKDIICSIDNKLGHKNYNMKVLGKNVTNIGVCTLDDFGKVKGLLQEEKVDFYTYTPKGLRPFSVVIEGLPCSFEPKDIEDYLVGLQMNIKVIGITRLGNDKWVLRMSRDSDIRKIYEVRYILRCRVHIRKFERKGITQCFNCQRYGHVSSNCSMPYRCVKCAGSHGPGKCAVPRKGDNNKETLTTDPVTGQITRTVGLPVKCANCGIDGHVASSDDCPRRAELLRKLRDRRATGGTPRTYDRPIARNLVSKGVSYATAARSASMSGELRTSAPAKPTGVSLSMEGAMANYDIIDKDCSRLFGGGFLQCLGKIGQFAKEYQTLDNDSDRTRALLGMLMTLGQDG